MAILYLSVPLTNARSASVGQNDSAELPHGLGQSVALDGCTDLFRAGGDVESAPGLKQTRVKFSYNVNLKKLEVFDDKFCNKHTLSPCLRACLMTEATLAMSSYEELVQLPISPSLTSKGQPFFLAVVPYKQISNTF
jgi:hypothetical protein